MLESVPPAFVADGLVVVVVVVEPAAAVGLGWPPMKKCCSWMLPMSLWTTRRKLLASWSMKCTTEDEFILAALRNKNMMERVENTKQEYKCDITTSKER